jgi:hypothetical protein
VAAICVSALLACTKTDQAWEEAVRTDTADAYGSYLQDHPVGLNAEQARARRDALVDDRDWGAARRADSVVGYTRYLAAHPDGLWSGLAARRSRELASPSPPPAAVDAAPPTAPEVAPPPVEVVVQLGAFSSIRSARGGWTKLQRSFVELQGRTPMIDVEPAPGSSLYRLRLKFDDVEEATRTCAALVRGGAECIKQE